MGAELIINPESMSHSGVKGMKWGYNDGSRNGRRTKSELSAVKRKAAEMAKEDSSIEVGKDFIGDYDEANNMLKYLGITLDLQSDNESVVKTMQIYKQMANNKDQYDSQYEWLKDFSNKLKGLGYDMDAVSKMLDENKDKLNVMETGTGTGNRERSNQDWKENDAPKKKSSSKKKTKSTDDKTDSSDSKSKSKTTTTAKKSKSTGGSQKKTTKKKSTIKKSTKSNISVTKNKSLNSTRTSYVYHAEENQNGDNLQHHGILGQRWGVRRYQNSDGSLTSEGRKHYGYKAARNNSSVDKLTGRKAARDSAKEANKISEEDAKMLNKVTSTTINSARNVNKAITKSEEAAYRKKVSKMSNEELEREIAKAMPDYEARILRQQLEQKYDRVVGNPNSTKEGRDKAMTAIETIGGLALTSGAVLDLIIKIKKL